MTDYTNYERFVKDMQTLESFKNNPNYTYILEHVTTDIGNQYYELLKNLYSNDIIEDFCRLNDSFGNPNKSTIGSLKISVSPTSLRYLYHATLILKHFSNESEIHIVELGGGYGGLCLAINFLARITNKVINSYHIIDLDSASKLQKNYLKNFELSFNVDFSSASDYGKNLTRTDYCLISNYCFSEIDMSHQENYIKHLIPKTKTGFLVWNHIQLYNFGKTVRFENEIPLTGPGNLYVYF
jgi:hypothetical protein